MDEGIYNATVVEHRFGESPRKKTPRLEVHFQLETDENIWGHIYFKNKEMARRSIKAIGFDIDNMDLAKLKSDTRFLTGNRCELELEDRGQYGVQVKWINSIGGSSGGGGGFDLGKLTQDLRDAKKQGESGPAPAPAPEPNPEDIPF
jgi:hypothetical protein